ncbi:MAG: hypothetical protein GY874_22155, partial [Desulfobacteraceae bacterium]|nr:hypothetical protein [Desulfobacteraceae bacterium]
MRRFNTFMSTAVIFMSIAAVLPAFADDLEITGTIRTTQSYDSAEGTILAGAILESDAAVTALSTYNFVIKPGTKISKGASLTVIMRDNDGLPNQWEMDNFGNMNQDPNGDEDNDGLTNLQEYTFGTDPNLSR